jgi:hypothetical protein
LSVHHLSPYVRIVRDLFRILQEKHPEDEKVPVQVSDRCSGLIK